MALLHEFTGLESRNERLDVTADALGRVVEAGSQARHEFGQGARRLEQLPCHRAHMIEAEVARAVEIEQDRPLVTELAVDDP